MWQNSPKVCELSARCVLWATVLSVGNLGWRQVTKTGTAGCCLGDRLGREPGNTGNCPHWLQCGPLGDQMNHQRYKIGDARMWCAIWFGFLAEPYCAFITLKCCLRIRSVPGYVKRNHLGTKKDELNISWYFLLCWNWSFWQNLLKICQMQWLHWTCHEKQLWVWTRQHLSPGMIQAESAESTQMADNSSKQLRAAPRHCAPSSIPISGHGFSVVETTGNLLGGNEI